MKTCSIFLILTLAFTLNANAQGTAYGIKGGVSLASFSGDDTDELDTRTGFMIGGFVTFPMGSAISIQPEVFYAQKGTKFDDLGSDVTFKLDYIDIPVLFKYTLAGENATPYFLFGPYIGFNITSERSANGQSVDLDNVASTDFGLVFGIGVNFQKFLLEVRYDMGLSNIIDDDTDPDSLNNTAFHLMLGYSF